MRSAILTLPLLLLSSSFVFGQADTVVRVQIDTPTKMKAGAVVRGHTVEPIYSNDRLVIPAGTPIQGVVSEVKPASKKRRLDAKFHGDFTPLHEAGIQFQKLQPTAGSPVAVETEPAKQGSDVLVFHSRNAKYDSLAHRAWGVVVGRKNEAISRFKGPNKAYRAKQVLYSQLPWHPESLRPGAEYDVHILHSEFVTGTIEPASNSKDEKFRETSKLHARLVTELDSSKSKPGDSVTAVLTEPRLDANNKVEIPQGTLLRGNVLQSSPAGKWGHNGELRFTFQKMEVPGGLQQRVTGVPKAVAGASDSRLLMDNEGGSKPESNRSLLAPLSLGLLAASAFTEDESSVGHAATSSNGFGLIGRIVAISTGSRMFGGTLGAISTGRSFYSHFLAHGKDVVFPRDTEIQVDLGPAAEPMHSTGKP